ncbi:MAG TPA: type II toxin-antitoxin system Phd/YefM family antitoxin [Polyangia bacterium]|jgi:antitoxin (DNA-binding transcriptional repressor) of toxin-antitoxin stability system
MKQVNLAEAKSHLSELIETALRGEEVVIARRDVPLVRLTAIPSAKVRPHFGRLAGKVDVRADFDEPLDDFGSYR